MNKKNQLSILIGGLGLATIQNYSPQDLASFGEANIDLIYLDSQDGQFNLIPDSIQKISANHNGAGGDISEGISKFQTIKNQVQSIIQDYKVITITTGFGGGTGSGFTIEIVKICQDLNKFCLVVGNTLKSEEYFFDRPKTQLELVLEILDISVPYILINSRKIENHLIAINGLAREYEIHFSRLSCNLILSLNLAIKSGLDLEDLKNNLGTGLIHFAVSSQLDSKTIFKDLTFDNFLFGKVRNLSSYVLAYPVSISQPIKADLLNRFDNDFEILDSKRQACDSNIFVLFGKLQSYNTPQNTPSIHPAYTQIQDTLINFSNSNNDFDNLTIPPRIHPAYTQHTPSIQLHTTDPQEFLDCIWRDENLDNLSYNEALKFINNNIQELENKYKISLKKEITKSSIQYYKSKKTN